MMRSLLFAFAMIIAPLSASGDSLSASNERSTASNESSAASGDEIVRYQLTDWKTKHIHDAKKADTITKTLKKLGCELKQAQHNGHIDVKYRCVEWHELKLDSHEEAHKWEKWLKEYHFKTEHHH